MASITSVISLFLLLAVYCYSAPIEQHYDLSTPGFDYTTGSSIGDSDKKITMQLISDDESTDSPNEHGERTSGFDTLEFTTSGEQDSASVSTRELEDSSSPVSSNVESSSEPLQYKRGLDDFAFTTFESSTEFQNRVIKPEGGQPGVESSSESSHKTRGSDDDTFTTFESSTGFEQQSMQPEGGQPGVEPSSESSHRTRGSDDDTFTTFESSTGFEQQSMQPEGSQPGVESSSFGTRGLPEGESDVESSTNFHQTSSVETFGKYTGLLKDEQPEGKPSQGKEGEPKPNEDQKDYSKEKSSQPEGKGNGQPKDDSSNSEEKSSGKSRKQKGQKHEESERLQDKSKEQNSEESTSETKQFKTLSIVPGKVIETRIYANGPSQTYTVNEPNHEQLEQLSQGEKQPIVEKEKSHN